MISSVIANAKYSLQTLRLASGFLMVAHLAGVIGLAWPVSRPYFLWATPINLVVSALLLLLFHRDWNRAFVFFLLLSYLLGFIIEVIGVSTEVVFGAYQYGSTLGIKLFEVPVVIGINWFVLAYCFGIICNRLPLPRLAKSIIAALMMVLLDILIEPVAIQLDFWQWQSNVIPIRNYVGWFVVAWVIELFFFYLPFAKNNQLAPFLLLAQFLFFLFLYSIV